MKKQKKHSVLKRAITIAIMSSLCLTAAIGVATFTQNVTVSDITTDVVDTETAEVNNNSEASLTEASVSDSMLNAFKVDNGEQPVSESSLVMTVKENEKEALAGQNEESETEIRIEKWCSLSIDLRGKKLSKDVPAGTVADALAYLGIELTDKDQMDAELEADVTDGMALTIKRVVVTEAESTEEIDFDKVDRDTSMLYEGESQVETEGEKGERKITYEVTWVNGKLSEKKEVSNEVIKEPVDEVTIHGTAKKEESRIEKAEEKKAEEEKAEEENNEEEKTEEEKSEEDTESEEENTEDAENDTESDDNGSSEEYSGNTITDSNGNVLHYSYCLSGPTTAYTAEAGAGTATGRLARYGVVAVDPDEIPYGSILYIVSDDGFEYGYAVAGDTGGFIYYTDVVVDLYFPTLDDCSTYGLRNAHVYVLEGVSEDATY